jgi:hypothetical protein
VKQGWSNYYAFQLTADERFSKVLSAISATLGRMRSTMYRSNSIIGMPHRLTVSYQYELPFGKAGRCSTTAGL